MKDGKMLWRFHRLAALVAAILTAGASPAEEQVLYWMVDGSAKVDKQDGSSPVSVLDYFADPEVQASGSDFAARIRVTGGDIQEGNNVFLDLYIPGYGVDVDGEYGVLFSDGSDGGYWGAGVPSGNQSPSGDYSAGTPEYSFIVELGNIDASDNWTTVATSAAATYTSLAAYIHDTFDMTPGQGAVWAPASFNAVPEPSGGVLTAIGLAVLALRRKRRLA